MTNLGIVGPRLYASMTSADPLRLADELERLLDAEVDGIHLDVADGQFVPDLIFGLRTVRAVVRETTALLDVHLMVVHPEEILRELAGLPSVRVAVHLEACPYPWRTISLARSLGMSVGLALNPVTPVAALGSLGAAIDFVNLLTTECDFAGERLLAGSEERIAAMRALLPPPVPVEVDGGVSSSSIEPLVFAGADEVVAGRAILAAADAARAVVELRAAAAIGWRRRLARGAPALHATALAATSPG